MIKYLIGAVVGGLLGYIVLHRLIGCSSGTCPITASPLISVIYGAFMGVVMASAIGVN